MVEPARWWVTSRLVLGEPPEFHSVPVTTAGDAVTVILSGGTALLPATHWPEARQVLEIFGLTPKEIADREIFAKTGHF